MSSERRNAALTIISSMATRHVLIQLCDVYTRAFGQVLSVLSIGGVEAARRVRNGEPFDIVVLASDAIGKLGESGHVMPGTKTAVARARIAAAVRHGEPQPDIGSEQALREAVLQARSVGYSSGPSGTHISGLLERWGVRDLRSGPRIVEAPAGVPVASLIADGEVELGFQQLSELIHQAGIQVVGLLPDAIQAVTVFSAAICSTTSQHAAAAAFLDFLSSPVNDVAKTAHGMEPGQV